MTLQELAGRFEGAKRTSGNSYQCKCPVHEDKKASLTISEKNNTLAINEQILKFAQNYPTISKTASSDAPFLMKE